MAFADGSVMRLYIFQLAGLVVCLSATKALAVPDSSSTQPYRPYWWDKRKTTLQFSSNDTALLTQAQLRLLATDAYKELKAKAPKSTWSTPQGKALTDFVSELNSIKGDPYALAKASQLKAVAQPFYDVLIQIGYPGIQPWPSEETDDSTLANIGQLKKTFNFDFDGDADGNGLPDWWEIKYFGNTGATTGYRSTSNPNGNGVSLLEDYQQGNDPTNYYSQGGTLLNPTITLVSGNNQVTAPSGFTEEALVIKVAQRKSGRPLANAPVTFVVMSGGGGVSAAWGGFATKSISALTDESGHAHCYYQSAKENGVISIITATANGRVVPFTSKNSPGDGVFDGPSDLTVTPVSPSEIDLTWVNHASSATSISIDSSTDNITWTHVVTLKDPTATSYSVEGLKVGQAYYFRIGANKPDTTPESKKRSHSHPAKL